MEIRKGLGKRKRSEGVKGEYQGGGVGGSKTKIHYIHVGNSGRIIFFSFSVLVF